MESSKNLQTSNCKKKMKTERKKKERKNQNTDEKK